MASLARRAVGAFALGIAAVSAATTYSIDSTDAIKQTSRQIAYDLMSYYKGNESGQTPGILPGPPPNGDYYWWEGGAMWGTMIDYWHLTGDTSYNDVITQSLLWQVGPNRDYMPPNVTASLGNDDQGFWGMTAMQAAEENFPNPPKDQPQWLALAQGIPFSNNGYDYKNSIANGCFFNLGARLARYTNNQTYADWAEKTWDWIVAVGFMDADYNIYDGAHVESNCTDINRAQFSYNNGVYLLGAAHMYNYTNGSALWKDRTQKLFTATKNTFFPNGTPFEISCETHMTCTTDMLSFKGYVARWMATATKIAPFLTEDVMKNLKIMAGQAIKTCTGGPTGRACGFGWQDGVFDGSTGAGQQMNSLSAVSSLLVQATRPPLTNATGGTSGGDYNAGIGSDDFDGHAAPITAGDRAGAAILTILLVGGAAGLFGWMSGGL
ncbi:glycoside hydrolase family 76 protein [Apiospora kogelbergensis]|uniref:glycoside hydrolase family 76 protein n=1 Tax=Apiospora kogelbergensis TaxID=1337665 RepID=UPI0031318E73